MATYELNVTEVLNSNDNSSEVIDREERDPHEMRDKLRGQVRWDFWLAQPTWTFEQAFILVRGYDPRVFPRISQGRPGVSQAGPNDHAYGPGELADLIMIVAKAARAGLECLAYPDKVTDMHPDEIFREAEVEKVQFLRWYLTRDALPPGLWRPLPSRLDAFLAQHKEMCDALPTAASDCATPSQPSDDMALLGQEIRCESLPVEAGKTTAPIASNRKSTKDKENARKLAITIWKQHPHLTSLEVAENIISDLTIKKDNGKPYSAEHVAKKWINDLNPSVIKQNESGQKKKRGRPRKS